MTDQESRKERVKILIVDDQPDNLLSAEAVLESLGEEIVTAQSGRDALRRLLKDDFGVIVLDVMMPDMDGLETAALIRSRDRSRDTPIIFLTALGKSEEYLFQGYDVGAVDYLFKPIVPQVLRAKASVFVELYRKRRLLEARNAALESAIARREQAEEEIRVLNQHLERRVMDLSDVNRELEAFSYSVSHDLRSPLSRIAGFSQALVESYSEVLDDQGRLYLERIHSSSQRVCELVDELLNLARLSRAPLRREQVDLSAMALAIGAEMAAREPGRQVRLDVSEGIVASGDPVLLKLTLQNLLENAWKFTRQREQACIEFGVINHQGVPAYYVRDDGAGFDMSKSARLFQPFQRLHSEAEFQGTGIGLATVDRIVKRHGGRVWAEGIPQGGATFYFTLQRQGN